MAARVKQVRQLVATADDRGHEQTVIIICDTSLVVAFSRGQVERSLLKSCVYHRHEHQHQPVARVCRHLTPEESSFRGTLSTRILRNQVDVFQEG